MNKMKRNRSYFKMCKHIVKQLYKNVSESHHQNEIMLKNQAYKTLWNEDIACYQKIKVGLYA